MSPLIRHLCNARGVLFEPFLVPTIIFTRVDNLEQPHPGWKPEHEHVSERRKTYTQMHNIHAVLQVVPSDKKFENIETEREYLFWYQGESLDIGRDLIEDADETIYIDNRAPRKFEGLQGGKGRQRKVVNELALVETNVSE